MSSLTSSPHYHHPSDRPLMETKPLVWSSSVPSGARTARPSHRRCVTVHVGSPGERDLALRRSNSDTGVVVPDKNKNQRENRRIREYYEQMLRSEPDNSLVLTNYGKFLHEVEGDVKGAMECYERAIVAGGSRADENGEAMALYGKLIWETEREKERAEAYMERAVQASPNDCYVLGSYAHFLWEADEESDSNSPSPSDEKS